MSADVALRCVEVLCLGHLFTKSRNLDADGSSKAFLGDGAY